MNTPKPITKNNYTTFKIGFPLLFLLLPLMMFGQASRPKPKKKQVATLPKKQAKPLAKNAKKIKTKVNITTPTSKEKQIVASPPIDTTPYTSGSVVMITSAFKPSLRKASKMQFLAGHLPEDTSKQKLSYNVPSQYLSFTYQPAGLKPIAFNAKPIKPFINEGHLKLGYGNYNSPLAEMGYCQQVLPTFRAGFTGRYNAAKGSLPYQEYKNAGLDIYGNIVMKDNNLLQGKMYFDNQTLYHYGFDKNYPLPPSDSLKRSFNDIGFTFGYASLSPQKNKLIYQPTLSGAFFNVQQKVKEKDITVEIPLEFVKEDGLAFHAALQTGLVNYTQTDETNTINNNTFTLTLPLSVEKKSEKLFYKVGMIPGMLQNNRTAILPDLYGAVMIPQTKLTIGVGWKGFTERNSIHSLIRANPFSAYPLPIDNILFKTSYGHDIFLDCKSSIGKHTDIAVTAAYSTTNDALLFINDTTAKQDIHPVYSPEIKAFKMSGHANFILQDKLSILLEATYKKFLSIQDADKAYHLIPFQMKGSIQWRIVSKVQTRASLWTFSNVSANQTKSAGDGNLSGVDASIFAEYEMLKSLRLWAGVNNLFNNKYQRWKNYEVLRIQIQAGFVFLIGNNNISLK